MTSSKRQRPAKQSPASARRAEIAAIGLRWRQFRDRHGRCFELAYLTIADDSTDPEWRLVHGSVLFRTDGRMGHAWLARGEFVYDPVLDRVFSWSLFRESHGAVERIAYTRTEAVRRASESRHSGPWVELADDIGDCASLST